MAIRAGRPLCIGRANRSSEILGHLLREGGWRHMAIRAGRFFANNLCIGRTNQSSEILGHLLRKRERRHKVIRAGRLFANSLFNDRVNLSSKILGHLLWERGWRQQYMRKEYLPTIFTSVAHIGFQKFWATCVGREDVDTEPVGESCSAIVCSLVGRKSAFRNFRPLASGEESEHIQ